MHLSYCLPDKISLSHKVVVPSKVTIEYMCMHLCVLLIFVIFIQNRAEEYLKTVNKQVLTLPIIEHVEKKAVTVAKWYNTYLNI